MLHGASKMDGSSTAHTRVKVCGITRIEDALAAADFGAWAVGLVFHRKSPRFVSTNLAREIIKAVPAGVLKIGVFMNRTLDEIVDIDKSMGLDLVQLHGISGQAAFPRIAPQRCIMAVSLKDENDLSRAVSCEARLLLVDRQRTPEGPKGGPVDQVLAASLAATRPFTLLAGALAPDNVAQAVRRVRPWGVDVSSGLESAPGIKDRARIEAFFAEVRRADAEGGAS
ncbi:MAG: phosphoribosylanthranilate isomerase [Deltaproteobacteria bacterium]|nr:phosphoribosylanthranilate isomerase [Deltaproteobacteria bacterium]